MISFRDADLNYISKDLFFFFFNKVTLTGTRDYDMDISFGGATKGPPTAIVLVGDRNRIWISSYNKVAKGRFSRRQQISNSCEETKVDGTFYK